MARGKKGRNDKKCQKYKTEKIREKNKKHNIEKQDRIFLKHVEKVITRVEDGTATVKMHKQLKRYKAEGIA